MTQYIVENKDTIPFKEMSDEDKLKIINALIGEPSSVEVYSGNVSGWDAKADDGCIRGYLVYRVRAKATPLNIPWKHIHPQWKYAAINDMGRVVLFKNKPELINNWGPCWWASGDECSISGILNINTDNINWELSLTKRP